MQTQNIKVVEYKNRQAFEKDANKLADGGWAVESITDRPQRSGIIRILLTGGIGLFLRPPSKVMVTYRHS